MHVTNHHFSDKFKNVKLLTYFTFYFDLVVSKTSQVSHVSCPKFVVHVANNQFSDKFNDGSRLLSSVLLLFLLFILVNRKCNSKFAVNPFRF